MSPLNIDTSLRWMLMATIAVYLVVIYGIAWFAKTKVHTNEDYVVAGRRLPLSLSWMTILATWFGAGTLLAVADEVRESGVQAAALDPLGAGVCLLIVGMFIAAPMWQLKLLTVSDFFALKWGRQAEVLSALILVPSYFGWIAAQFVALAGMLTIFFGLDPFWGIAIVAAIGTGYTMLGGMWSVTLTDAVQIMLVLIGLIVMLVVCLGKLAGGDPVLGFQTILEITPADRLALIPHRDLVSLLQWLSVFVAGALGNIPAQDLMQRVFAAKSAKVASMACLIAGVAYLAFGAIPVILALSVDHLLPDAGRHSILPVLAQTFLSPPVAIIFVVVLMSAVLSTIDSAMLSPASVLAHNVFRRARDNESVAADRIAVLFVALGGVWFAYRGESAYAMLEAAYELPLVGLFVPLVFGLKGVTRTSATVVASMTLGTGVWLIHHFSGWAQFLQPVTSLQWLPLPMGLCGLAISLVTYLLGDRVGAGIQQAMGRR